MRLSELTSRRLILLAGVTLVAVGVVCLYLSDAVAHTGSWWQGTLDAFGVGFVVGGIVDVTAISLLNQILTGSAGPAWRAQNDAAIQLLERYGDESNRTSSELGEGVHEIGTFIKDHGAEVDHRLVGRLRALQDRLTKIEPSSPMSLD